MVTRDFLVRLQHRPGFMMGVHVLATLEARPVVRRPDRPELAATALPGVPDPPQASRGQLSVRLLESYGADYHGVQHDEESLEP